MSNSQWSELLKNARERDPEAIAQIYEQNVGKIARYISYRVSDQQAIEDLTANVFLIMVEKLPRFRDRGVPFEAWLYRIASTQVADYYRKRRKNMDEILHEFHPSKQAPLELAIQQREHIAALQKALNRLTEDEQIILYLRFSEQKKHQEIADMLGKKAQAVATAQHRALKRLADFLVYESEGRLL